MGNKRVMGAVNGLVDLLSSDSSTVDADDYDQIKQAHPCETTGMEARERRKMMAAVQKYIGESIDWNSLDVPLLTMYGEEELFAEQHSRYVASKVGECRVAEIPEATHNSHVDNPAFIIEQIKAFLTDVSEESSAGERRRTS